MKRSPVNSSSIRSVGFEEGFGLEVEYKNGGVYHYPGVSADEHRDLMAAPSIGSHFATRIRNAKDSDGKPRYSAIKLEAPRG
jgi:hypothetical protein